MRGWTRARITGVEQAIVPPLVEMVALRYSTNVYRKRLSEPTHVSNLGSLWIPQPLLVLPHLQLAHERK